MTYSENEKLIACLELIKGLERENRILNQMVDTQRALIDTLEAHNAEMEKTIRELARG